MTTTNIAADFKNEEFKKLTQNKQFKERKNSESKWFNTSISVKPIKYYVPPVPPIVRPRGVRLRTLSAEDRAILRSSKRIHSLIIKSERDIKYFPQMGNIYETEDDKFLNEFIYLTRALHNFRLYREGDLYHVMVQILNVNEYIVDHEDPDGLKMWAIAKLEEYGIENTSYDDMLWLWKDYHPDADQFMNVVNELDARMPTAGMPDVNYRPQGLFSLDEEVRVDMQKAIHCLEDISNSAHKFSGDEAFGKIGIKLDDLISAMKGEALKDNIDVLSGQFKSMKENVLGMFMDGKSITQTGAMCLIGAAGLWAHLKPGKLSTVMFGFTVALVIMMCPDMSVMNWFIAIMIFMSTVLGNLLHDGVTKVRLVPQGVTSDAVSDISTALASFFGIGFQCMFGKNLGLDFVKGLGDFTRVKGTFNDVLSLVIRTTESVVNKIRDKLMLPSVRFLDSNRTNVNKYLDKIAKIFEKHARGNLTYTHANFTEVETLLHEGMELLRKCGNDRNDMNISRILSKDIKKIEDIHSHFLNSNFDIAGTRAEALGVMLAGGPGVGKTVACQALTYAIAAVMFDEESYNDFLENPKNYVYPRNTENVFWDALTWRHWFIIWDDFGQAADVAGKSDNEFFEWIRAVNPFEYRVHKAGMEEKGLITFNGKIVIGNTNHVTWKAKSIIEVGALLRRFNVHVCVVPKPEYCTDLTRDNDIWNRKFDKDKLPRRKIKGKEVTIFDQSCQLYIPIDADGDPMGDGYDFEELVRQCVRGIRQRQDWKEASVVLLEEVAQRFREPRSIEVLNSLNHIDVQMELVPQMGKFGSMSIREFNDIAFPENIVVKFGDRRKNAQKLAKDWLTCWHTVLVKVPEFFEALDELINVIAEPQGCPYAQKLAAIILMDDFPKFTLDDGPERLTKAFVGYKHFVDSGEVYFDIDDTLFSYNTDIEYNLENYDAFFLDFDRLLEQPELSAVQRVYKSILENKYKWIAAGSVITLLISIPLVSTFGSWVVSLFKKEEAELVPQYGHIATKIVKTNPQTLLQRINALPQMGNALDSNGQAILDKVMKSNFYSFYGMDDGERKHMGNLVFICSRIMLIPFHYLKGLVDFVERGLLAMDDTLEFERNGGFNYPVRVGDIIQEFKETTLLQNDMILLQLPLTYPNHKDIRDFFCKASDLERLDPTFMVTISGCKSEKDCIVYAKLTGCTPIGEVPGTNLGTYEVKQTISYEVASKNGDCGALVFVMNPKVQKRKIFGVHVAGDANYKLGIAGVVTREMIDEALIHLSFDSTLKHEDEVLGAPTNICPQMTVLGKVSKYTKRQTKSDIVPTPLSGIFIDKFSQPAKLRPFMLEGNLVEPMKLAYKKYGNNKSVLNQKWLHESMLSYFEKVMEGGYVTSRKNLTVEEALLGIESETASSRINPKTSPGHPMTIPGEENLKELYFNSTGVERAIYLLKIEEKVREATILMLNGVRLNWYYQDNNKMERLDYEKASRGKVRLFSGCPFIYLILVKMYFGSFIIDYTKKRNVNGSTLGINVYSREWDLLVRSFASVDPSLQYLGFGDFSHYDGDHIPDVEYENLNIINMWYGHESSKDSKIIRGILFEECVYSFHILDGDIVEWCRGLPSGTVLTPILNTMYNQIIFRYAWRISLPMDMFNEVVVLKTNGDDNGYSINPLIAHKFTPKIVAERMAIIGMTYTNERKNDDELGFRSISEVQFLKRGFSFDYKLHRYVAPLQLETILDMINWSHEGKEYFVTICNNVSNVTRELSLHGKDIFDTYVPLLVRSYRAKLQMPILTICDLPWEDVYRIVLGCGSE